MCFPGPRPRNHDLLPQQPQLQGVGQNLSSSRPLKCQELDLPDTTHLDRKVVGCHHNSNREIPRKNKGTDPRRLESIGQYDRLVCKMYADCPKAFEDKQWLFQVYYSIKFLAEYKGTLLALNF